MKPERKEEVRYTVTLPVKLNEYLDEVSGELHTSKAEVLRRALVLLKHAVDADKVELTKGGEKQTVLLK